MRVSGDLDFKDMAAWSGSAADWGQAGVKTFVDGDVPPSTDKGVRDLRDRMSNMKLYERFEVKGMIVQAACSPYAWRTETNK